MVVNYQYYANGWLKRVLLGTVPIAEYTYDETGNRTNILLGNGATTAYVYDADPRYRVSSIAHTPYNQSAVTISYPTRDGAGNPLSMQDWNGTVSYAYDMNSRLTAWARRRIGTRTTPGGT